MKRFPLALCVLPFIVAGCGSSASRFQGAWKIDATGLDKLKQLKQQKPFKDDPETDVSEILASIVIDEKTVKVGPTTLKIVETKGDTLTAKSDLGPAITKYIPDTVVKLKLVEDPSGDKLLVGAVSYGRVR